MDAWLIVLITISSGLALFAVIFAIKNKREKKMNENYQNRATTVHVVSNQPPYPQQMPPQYGFNQQPAFAHPPIPSTANQGILNPQNPQAYYNPNMPQVIQLDGRGTNARFVPMVAPSSGMMSNPAF